MDGLKRSLRLNKAPNDGMGAKTLAGEASAIRAAAPA